jgi:hypothetical protein
MKFKDGLPALFLSFFLITSVTTRPLSRRDLGGVFGGLLEPGEQGAVTIPPGSSASKQEHGLSAATATTIYANGELTKVHETTASSVTSILAPTINEIATFSGNSWPSTWSSSSAGTITPWPTQGPTSYAQNASHMPPGEETEWKVIGITVFCITIIGAMMLATFFSDTLIKAFKDVCLCGNRKRKKRGEENLVPDWQMRSWEYKLADEEGHRYPTVSSSLQSMAEKSKSEMQLAVSPMVAPPEASYLPELDPHPLDPLLRRPSCKQLN